MKNNRLTNREIIELRNIADRIRELASLERASFGHVKEEDEYIKKSITPYMMWFVGQANYIESILDGKFNSFDW